MVRAEGSCEQCKPGAAAERQGFRINQHLQKESPCTSSHLENAPNPKVYPKLLEVHPRTGPHVCPWQSSNVVKRVVT